MKLLGFSAEIIHASIHLVAFVEIPVDLVTDLYPGAVYRMHIRYCLN
jgi:hypothetical protein